ncbi:uncharacterized protein LOC132919472 isoform X2 [Rhopalosiphum padi]|uniref:uncharacterized protein LOC132919472 isoform X2 n=1 Tax=Rhopalosiphum padi TaxID=40932 RepID=UPI00298E2378|nr:uncharacterized protein LOC132919472 isoform X2 [Rhopalosiphum padi]
MIKFVCKLYLLLCLGLSTNASPILNGLKTTSSNYQQSNSSLQHESLFSPNSDYGNVETKLKSQMVSAVDQSLKNTPGITTTYRDQNGNLITQVKKETFNKENGQSSHAFEIQESKQLPNGYSKSFKKEYSSSGVTGSQPTVFVQTPLNTDKYYNSEQLSNGESSLYGSFQNYQGQSIPANIGNVGIKSNFKSTVDQSLTNVPGVTTTFRDQNGNIVTQVKKEIVTNNDGQNGHVTEFEETKQLPNGYSKSFRKEYSSSGVTGYQPTVFVQKPLNTDKYYNSEQLSNGESSLYGSFQNYQGQSIPANIGNVGIKSNFKSTVDQSLTNVPGVTTTFRDQNGNIVTQVKKEIVTNNDGQNGHVTEFEETKQLPNGYSKSFRKEYSSSSVVGIQPTLIKVNTTEKNTYLPQQIIQGETEKFNGYNTFFNNKYTIEPNSPINSQVLNNKKQSLETIETTGTLKGNSFSLNTKDQIDCDKGPSSTNPSNQDFKQQPINTNYSPVGQQVPVNINHFSTQTQAEVGQQSVDLHRYTNPSQIGQQSVDISNLYVPKKPNSQKFEKIESFSTQTQAEVGQQSVDLHGYTSPSQIGQQSVDISNLYVPKKPNSQKFEKIESFSTQTQGEVGQQSVDLNGYTRPSQIGQQSVDYSNLYVPKKPISQKFEKIESFSTQTQGEVGQQSVDLHGYTSPSQIGQQSVDLHGYTSPSQIGQQSVDISNLYVPNKPSSKKFEKIESFSTQTQGEVGQQSIDLHGYTRPSQIGQQSVDYSNLYVPKKPISQKFEKIESFSTQTQGEVGQQSVHLHGYTSPSQIGQQSVDLHGYTSPSQIGQQSVDISNLYVPKKPNSQKFEKIESFSTQTQEEVGQQSVDLHGYTSPSQIGQQSVDISNLYVPNKPSSKKFEKIESFSTQTQGEVGQQSVDLHGYTRPSQIGQQSVDYSNLYVPKKPISQKFEKIESFSTQTQGEVGQQSVDLHGYTSPSQIGQQSVDLHGYTSPSQIGQQSVDFSNLYVPKKPNSQKFEKIESFSTQTQEEVGQQSVDLHGYTSPSQIGQQSVDISNLYVPNKPSSKKFEKIESFSTQTQEEVGQQSVDLHGYTSPSQIGQQSVDISNLYVPNKQYGNVNFQSSKLSTQTGQLSTGNNEPINSKYNSVFDKLGQLEHEILGAKSTVNINKGNVQTTYSTNHNVKSMPVQTSYQESNFSKKINENTQYIEPESEIAYSKSFHQKDSKLVIQQDAIENPTSNTEHFSENPTTPSSVWKKIGDKFKGTIENAKNKAQQLASNINDKVGFSSVTGNPC